MVATAFARRELISWIDTDAIEHRLTFSKIGAARVDVIAGLEGFFMPDFDFTRETQPLSDGTVTRYVSVSGREVVIPLLIKAPDRLTLRQIVGQVIGWFDPRKGEGIIRVTNPDRIVREIRARYTGGLEARGSEGGVEWQRLTVTLWCDDPFWSDTQETERVFLREAPIGTVSTASFFPVMPVAVSPSGVYASPIVTNPGHTDGWPVWTIQGPATEVTLRNLTTGEELAIPAPPLGAGDIVIVDTRPGFKFVARNGFDVFPSGTSSLWAFRPGSNSIQVAVTGAAEGTWVRMTVRWKYLGVR